MLYLTREINETVMIGDDIQVKVMRVEKGKVVLGFKAPINIKVNREEVHLRIQKKISNDSSFDGENRS
jgi:carbon storage regulator